DMDGDGCDDCSQNPTSVVTPNSPAWPLYTPNSINDGTDTDGDGICNSGDSDDDNDGVFDVFDPAKYNPDICGDSDGDGCDDCSVGTDNFGPLSDCLPNNDGTDTDGDGMCNLSDPDDDNDGVDDITEIANATDPLNPDVCGDSDGDGCDDCSVGTDNFGPLADNNPSNDGTDTDGDGMCNSGDPDDDNDGCLDGVDPSPQVYSVDTDGDGQGNDCDPDDDNDGVPDVTDIAPLNPQACSDMDGDGCDDCSQNPISVSTPAPWPLYTPSSSNDGTDTDGDGLCNSGDPDDDNDGVLDASDVSPLNPDLCEDSDGDGCDDCSVGTDNFGPLADNLPNNDGIDTDGDGLCNSGDTDDDNDGVDDATEMANATDPLNPDVCGDSDGDGCDDCSVGTDNFGPLADNNPANDGTDTDGDGMCNSGDPDDDNDGKPDGSDTNPVNPQICGDSDFDGCDDCSQNPTSISTPNSPFWPLYTPSTVYDGLDTDGDGQCNSGDPDDDNDGCFDVQDYAPLTYSIDTDGDGEGNDCDLDDDNDGVMDLSDTDPLNPQVCQDSDLDGCDDCSMNPTTLSTPNSPAWPLYTPSSVNDGIDTDGDGQCNSGDPDDDNDGCLDGVDTAPQVYSVDTDGDGQGNDCDNDDDNDGVDDVTEIFTTESDPLNPDECGDQNGDGCDDCETGTDDFGPQPDNIGDITAPSVICPGDQFICNNIVPDFSGIVTITDNCDASPGYSQSISPGNTVTGPVTISITASDAATNSSQCSFLLTPDGNNTGDTIAVACESLTWYGTTYISTSTAVHTFTNMAGCDSVVTLDLTINYSNSGTDIQTACDSYTWIDGITYTSSNNTATHTLTNISGCDSVIILDLTINTVDTLTVQSGTTITANAIGASYQWLDCDNSFAVITSEINQSFTAIVNGNFAVEITQNGCIDTSSCVSITNVGIELYPFVNNIQLYPNPTVGTINIVFEKEQKEIHIIIRDITGKAFEEYNYTTLEKISYNIDGPRGLYFIEIYTPIQKTVFKLMKQ
ncbi:MAG: T9SS type A sorting domain-containing protein, partial [Bacteroidota bacterium]